MAKTKRRKRAEKWFAAHGINPNTPNSDGNAQVLDMKPAMSFTADMDVGDLSSAGVIYFGSEATLLKATTFGVAFGAEDGGVVQVTWGTSGNATAAGIGEGLGAFGGSGSFKEV